MLLIALAATNIIKPLCGGVSDKMECLLALIMLAKQKKSPHHSLSSPEQQATGAFLDQYEDYFFDFLILNTAVSWS